MIYLTGDVHERIIGSWEQDKINSNDLASTIKYLEILKKYKIKSTLFLNGILLDNYPEEIKKILKFDVELGGHTYDNFGKMGAIKCYLFRKIFGGVYGPRFYQKKDILKTKKAFEKTGLKMSSWRTHSFGSNKNTFELLKNFKVKFISDFLGEIIPFEKNKIIHIPINIPVDQNTIAFGKLKPENRNPFASCTKGRISSDEWFEILKKRIILNEKNKIDSIILIHPMTMDVLDNFKLFEDVAKFLTNYKSGKISEIKQNAEVKILNLGCGNDFYGTDRIDFKKTPAATITLDINKNKLPFPDNYFDEIRMYRTFEHIKNCNLVVSEIYRTLKVGGKIDLITDSAGYFLFHIKYKEKCISEEYIKFKHEDDGHFSLFLPGNLREHFKKFKNLKISYLNEKGFLKNLILKFIPFKMGYEEIRLIAEK